MHTIVIETCDKKECPAPAKFKVLPGRGSLYLCGHHRRVLNPGLVRAQCVVLSIGSAA